MALYKSFIRPHLDYGDIIFNNPFQNKIESVQYNAFLAITGAIRRTSKERLYEELGFESLQHRLWYRKLCYLCKIIVITSLNYLFKVVPSNNTIYNTGNTIDIPLMNTELDPAIRNSASFNSFK